MANYLEYKGYHAKVEFCAETMTLRGKIEGIIDYVDFECADLTSVEKEFHAAVDDYLDFCKEVGKLPEKEYKGSFNVRISPELHKKLALCAFKEDISLNASVERAITAYVESHQTEDGFSSDKDKTNESAGANVHGDNVITFSPAKHE